MKTKEELILWICKMSGVSAYSEVIKAISVVIDEYTNQAIAASEAGRCENCDLNEKINQGRHYLMGVEPNKLTVEDALGAFGFGRNGLL